ncbi:FAD-binding oxidoreductase [Reyranella sp. CPCC 100927]|uniref:NAD(P)/FAD-dependent oxidoreductase n=1 Tax=Reyranella sp. CPCC 100927 TaxID=2599616 RepID=UPI0011B3D64A|nr:FAD-dependent oxidoreductase [Reyranella sp. CPCC 100927]TWT15855.1 FAD-dependent oxidoreductase [Reyranella sp. CPCC 100927]
MHAIVVGAGISGLSTAWALAKRGHRVTLLERDAIPNPLGASGDHHRIIRRAYRIAMHGYTVRMTEAFATWDELWADLGAEHIARVGFMGIVTAPGDNADQYRDSLRTGGYPFETLTKTAALARFPYFNPEGFHDVFVSQEGGALLCLRIATDMVRWLRDNGVAVREHTVVTDIDTAAASVTLSSGERLSADVVVVTAGAWVTGLLPDLTGRLASKRTYVVYLEPPAEFRAAWELTPVIPGIGGDIGGYILPPVAGTDLKFGAGATRVDWTADTPFELAADAGTRLRDMFAPLFRRMGDYSIKRERKCVYTFTHDERFFGIRRGATWIVSACSGHGYKFGAAIGRRVADAVESGDEQTLTAWLEARD